MMHKRVTAIKSIGLRMLFIVMAGSSAGLAIMAAVYMTAMVELLTQKRQEQLQAEMAILAASLSAAVAFEDTAIALEQLEALSVDNDIVYGEVFSNNGVKIADFFNPGYAALYGDKAPYALKTHKKQHLEDYRQDIVVDGKAIGYLRVFASASTVRKDIGQAFLAILMTLILVSAFVLILSRRLLQSLIKPIAALHETSSKILLQGDYSLRATIYGDDEIAALATTFNRMLEHIAERDRFLEQTVRDRTAELERLAEQFRHGAFHDALTDLPNRALLMERIQHVIARAQRHKQLFAVMLMDVDNFKTINDTLGHDVGDSLLQQLSARLQKSLRAEDFICRLGGDEFFVIIENIASNQDIDQVATKLLTSSMAPFTLKNANLSITLSMGGAIYPDHGQDLTTLKRAADIAMYVAKENGKNQFRCFESPMESAARQRLLVQNELHDALKRGEIILYFQPQVKLSHQNPDMAPLYGCEVLVRWQHPTLGLLNPDLFIPYAEDAGLVQLIDYYVLDSACQQARIWHQAGWNISVSVNLSGLHFRNTTIADKIEKALRTSNLPPHLLNIELTEAVLISDNAIATKVVSQIKMLGVKVSLDDFGVGYSSLNYLRTLPFDVIKLDKSFVSSILSQPQDKKLTEGIIKLASSLDLTVVAEGIETLEHAEVLFKLGCIHMQGYYFSRPLNKADFESWHFKRLELRNA